MRIINLVENTTHGVCKSAHGLSLYIETIYNKILFDVGPDETIFKNALVLGVNLEDIDTVIISHGHYDHAGALKAFLEINHKATIYIQERAFLKHYNLNTNPKHEIGIDESLKNHPQVKLLNGDYVINDYLSLFTVKTDDLYHSPFNDSLYEFEEADNFLHEQNLILKTPTKNLLFMGCGHKGVINILENSNLKKIDYCFGGFHLYSRKNNETVSKEYLDNLNKALLNYPNTIFYTCHCTGLKAYNYLASINKNIHYFSVGDLIKIL